MTLKGNVTHVNNSLNPVLSAVQSKILSHLKLEIRLKTFEFVMWLRGELEFDFGGTVFVETK